MFEKIAFCKVLSISVITLFFSLITTTESRAETTCSWSGTTLTVSGTGTFSGCSDGSQKNAGKVIIGNEVTSIGDYAFKDTQIPNCSLSELDKCHLPCTNGTTCTAISCPAGKYLDGSECKPCAAGSYSGAGDNVCSSCGAHEYSAAGASSCTPRQNFSNCNEFSTDSDECTSCKTGYKSENGGCVSMCSGGKVYWDGECYDEYPFAKKRYTPAEAAPWLKDNGNVVTLIFKK